MCHDIKEYINQIYSNTNKTLKVIVVKTLCEAEANPLNLTPHEIGLKILEGFSVYEQIDSTSSRRIYLDIENIPGSYTLFDARSIVSEIANDFRRFFGLFTTKYIITYNHHSRHERYSFHVIFNVAMNSTRELRNMVRCYKQNSKLTFSKFVDGCVYNDIQYFRLPCSFNATNPGRLVYQRKIVYDNDISRRENWKCVRNFIATLSLESAKSDDFHYPWGSNQFFIGDTDGCMEYKNPFIRDYIYIVDRLIANNRFLTKKIETNNETNKETNKINKEIQRKQENETNETKETKEINETNDVINNPANNANNTNNEKNSKNTRISTKSEELRLAENWRRLIHHKDFNDEMFSSFGSLFGSFGSYEMFSSFGSFGSYKSFGDTMKHTKHTKLTRSVSSPAKNSE